MKKRRFVSLIMAAVMVGSIFAPTGVFAETKAQKKIETKALASDERITVSDEEQLKDAIEQAQTGVQTEIQLTSDVELTESLEIPQEKDIILSGDSAQRKLTLTKRITGAAGSETLAVIMVTGTLALKNLVVDANSYARIMTVQSGGEVTLESGAVLQNGKLGTTTSNYGAGINLKDGSAKKTTLLTINSGTKITGCTVAGEARIRGVAIAAGRYTTITMNGGNIENNTDLCTGVSGKYSLGGGIYLNGAQSQLIMKDGAIANNTAKGGGGGIYVDASASCELTGGVISNNKAATNGGGAYVLGEMKLSGAKISENTVESSKRTAGSACGGGIYIADWDNSQTGSARNYGTVYMTGGSIEKNQVISTVESNDNQISIGQGGGIYSAGRFEMSGGTIEANKAVSSNSLDGMIACGGGVSLRGGNAPGEMKMSGGRIQGNDAGNTGGGIQVNSKEVTSESIVDEDEISAISGNAKLCIEGSAMVSENTGNQEDDNIYLPRNAEVWISGALQNNAEILIGSENHENGTVVAKGDSYTITETDLKRILDNKGAAEYQLNGNNEVCILKQGEVSLEGAEIKVDGEYIYTGDPIKAEAVVTTKDGETLTAGVDYTLLYKNNQNVGNATVQAKGIGNYKDSVETTFEILPKDLAGKDIYFEKISKRIATGQEITPKTYLYYKGNLLEENTDYTVSFAKNTSAGTADIEIRGKGNFTGTRTSTFEILDAAELTIADSETSLTTAISSGKSEVFIREKIELTEPLVIPAGMTLSISGDGNDAALTAANSIDAAKGLLQVEGNLTLENVTVDAQKKTRAVYIEKNGTFTEDAASSVRNGMTDYSGGGVHNEGTFNLAGGTIEDCKVTAKDYDMKPGTGGGIYNSGTANLDGGLIQNNSSAAYGGAIGNFGVMKIENCIVKENTADLLGGGIYTENELTMEGGRVDGNTVNNSIFDRVSACGGGVYLAAGTFTMNDGIISENTARINYANNLYYASIGNGGGVYVSNNAENHCVFEMNGGIIARNSAECTGYSAEAGYGGGVYVMGGEKKNEVYPGSFKMNGGTITDNAADTGASGILVNNGERAYGESFLTNEEHIAYTGSGIFTLSGSAIVSGNENSDLHFNDGAAAAITDVLTCEDGSIGVSSGTEGDAIIAEAADGYAIKESDVKKFFSNEENRPVEYKDGEIFLAGINIEEGFVASLEKNSYIYTGKEIKPTVTVKNSEGTILKVNEDYAVSYSQNSTDAGRKMITITGKGKYSGSLKVEYEIVPKAISQVAASVPDQSYTGKAIQPVSAISVKDGSKALLRGEDYRIVSYSNNVNAGAASVIIEGQGNYSGKRSLNFRIIRSVSGLTVRAIGNKAYTGRALKPVLRVSASGKVLRAGTNYTVSYRNNVKTGLARATITGKGYYKGTKSVTFRIVPKKAKLNKLTKGKKSLTVKWRRDKQADGYQLLLSTNKTFKKQKKTILVRKNKTTKKTVKRLKAKKRYYVKIRAYKTIGGKKYYGAYSSVKKIKTK